MRLLDRVWTYKVGGGGEPATDRQHTAVSLSLPNDRQRTERARAVPLQFIGGPDTTELRCRTVRHRRTKESKESGARG